MEKNRINKYEKPEIIINIFKKTLDITMSYNFGDEGYGDEIYW